MKSLSSINIQSWLPWFMRGLLLLGVFILLGRLIELQIIKGDYYRSLSDENRIRRVVISAPRGKVYARGGELLIGNKGIKKRVIFDPKEGYELIIDIKDAPEEEIVTEYDRYYPLKESLAHIGGYIGKVGEDEIGKSDPGCLEKGVRGIETYVGRGGLEEYYNCKLTGIDGEELIEVDTKGKRVRTLGRKGSIPGEDIHTNIDFGLQKEVSEIMENKPGAVVVTDSGGQVLALYSSPSYDPNAFVGKTNSEKVQNILTDENLPLFNRAIGGLYHPGSVYKPIVAIAALEEGKVDREYLFNDEGQIVIDSPYGTFIYANWYYTQYGGKEGEINITRAIARSTDTFFYKMGEFVGVDKLYEWSSKFGLDDKTGIDIPAEIEGLVPDPDWKIKTKGEKWFLGNTYHMSIGQGDLALTPVLVNSVISAISADGQLCSPKVVGEGECIDLNINQENLNIVKEGMTQACSTDGTGFTFFESNPKVACKTGTAETIEENVTHAWFTFYSPAEEGVDPEIVVTVLVEKGGEGSKVAGPVAKDIFNYWYHIEKDREVDKTLNE